MRDHTIEQFMWGFRSQFRGAVDSALQKSLESLGLTVEPTVLLIGQLRPGSSRHPLCGEPEDGPIVSADFDGLRGGTIEFYRQAPTAS